MATSTASEATLMYKNKLQEYTQKHALPLPSYSNVNEGFQHAPNFRSTVLVDGRRYESKSNFPTRKQAEQEAAKVALESLSKHITDTGCPLFYKDPRLCKSILYEYAVKNNLERPSFRTNNLEESGLVFLSSVVFGGKTYNGEVAGSKKMAEKLAARAAIMSLLETDAESMSSIIQSSYKHLVGNSAPNQASIHVSKNLHQGQTSSQFATAPKKELTCELEISPGEQNWMQNRKVAADPRNGPAPGFNNWEQNKKTVADTRNGPKRKLESSNWNLKNKKNLRS